MLPRVVESDHLAQQVAVFFRGPQPWIYTFVDAVGGLSAAQASIVSAPKLNSIYAVVYHVTFWHDVVLGRLRGRPVDDAGVRQGGWPERPDVDEAEWSEARTRVLALNAAVAAEVAALDPDALAQAYVEGRATRWQMAHGLVAHTAYHTGEIVTLRALQGVWDRP